MNSDHIISYIRNSDDTITVVHSGFQARTSAQTARNDGFVQIEAGSFIYKPVLIGGQPCSYDEAYYFAAQVTGVLVSGGYDNEVPGETVRTAYLRPYGYSVRTAVFAAKIPLPMTHAIYESGVGIIAQCATIMDAARCANALQANYDRHDIDGTFTVIAL